MASAAVSVDGIRAAGRHGANLGEQALAQEFVVDVEFWVDVEDDSLDATLDYRTVVATVRETVQSSSFHLLESLAEAVASALIDLDPVVQVTAVVHKPGAAASMGVADVSAEVTLDRA